MMVTISINSSALSMLAPSTDNDLMRSKNSQAENNKAAAIKRAALIAHQQQRLFVGYQFQLNTTVCITPRGGIVTGHRVTRSITVRLDTSASHFLAAQVGSNAFSTTFAQWLIDLVA